MLGTVLHGPRDVRFEEVQEPTILHPTDAIIRLSATCSICGSDLWPYRGLNDVSGVVRPPASANRSSTAAAHMSFVLGPLLGPPGRSGVLKLWKSAV
jgi:hypothetical protein